MTAVNNLRIKKIPCRGRDKTRMGNTVQSTLPLILLYLLPVLGSAQTAVMDQDLYQYQSHLRKWVYRKDF